MAKSKAVSAEPQVLAMGDRVIVRPDPKKSTSEGGIVLPEHLVQTKSYEWGTIAALSHGTIDEKWGKLEVGNRVLYPAYTVTTITDDKENPLYTVPVSELAAIQK